MTSQLREEMRPSVSVVLATHNRPQFLPLALACYRQQTYTERELIVVDDSTPPIEEGWVREFGGRLLRVPPGTVLGDKLNHGLAHARGPLSAKIDDDDWYAPDYLDRMVGALVDTRTGVTRRIVAAIMPFRFFDLAPWEIRENSGGYMSGATLTFLLEDWRRCPFRSIQTQEDSWFVYDQVASGVRFTRVQGMECFLQVRHRRHLWNQQPDGTPLIEYIPRLPLAAGGPEALLPPWALDMYRDVRERVLSGESKES